MDPLKIPAVCWVEYAHTCTICININSSKTRTLLLYLHTLAWTLRLIIQRERERVLIWILQAQILYQNLMEWTQSDGIKPTVFSSLFLSPSLTLCARPFIPITVWSLLMERSNGTNSWVSDNTHPHPIFTVCFWCQTNIPHV